MASSSALARTETDSLGCTSSVAGHGRHVVMQLTEESTAQVAPQPGPRPAPPAPPLPVAPHSCANTAPHRVPHPPLFPVNKAGPEYDRVQEIFELYRRLVLDKQVTAPDAASTQADSAEAWVAVRKALSREERIKQEYAERAEDIAAWGHEVSAFQPSSMQELQAFVRLMDANLAGLHDEEAMIKLAEKEGVWPTARYDTFQQANRVFGSMEGLRQGIEGWQRPAGCSCTVAMAVLQKLYERLQSCLHHFDMDRRDLDSSCKDQGLTFPLLQLRGDLVRASGVLVRAHTAEVLQEVHNLAQKQPLLLKLQEQQKAVLAEGIRLFYKTQLLLGGLDPLTRQCFEEYSTVVQQVHQGTYMPAQPADGTEPPTAGAPVASA